MARKQAHTPRGWETAKPPYSIAMSCDSLVFVSGRVPIDPKTKEIVGRDIREQARNTLDQIRDALEAAGATMDDCVKIGVFLADLKDFEAFNEVYKTYFKDPMPCRTCVGVHLWEGVLVEIDAIAVRGAGG